MAASLRDPRNGVRLVAERDGALVGSASITRRRPGLCRHVAVLGVGVAPEQRGRGIGRLLVERALAWPRGPGRAEPAVTRVELQVRADNPRAIALYESFGFAIEGTRRGAVRTLEGALIDEHIMLFTPR